MNLYVLKRQRKNNMSLLKYKKRARLRRSLKTRCKLKSLNMLRLIIHRTSRHMYAQIIDSKTNRVLISASTVERVIQRKISTYTGNKIASSYIGFTIANRALQKNIKVVAFDRSGFKYHGRVKALAEAARENGLEF